MGADLQTLCHFLSPCPFKQMSPNRRLQTVFSRRFGTIPRSNYYLLPSSHSTKRAYIRDDGSQRVIGSPLRIAERHTHWIRPAKANSSALMLVPLPLKYLTISGLGFKLSAYANTCLLLKLLVALEFDAIQQRRPLSSTYFSNSF